MKKNNKLWSMFLLIFLQGCASSNVTREANDNVAVGYQNTSSSFYSMGDGSIADSFENSSQRTKGMLIGGTIGAVAGGLTSGVGVIPGLPIGAIWGGAYGAYLDSKITLEDQLKNRGVKVIVLGDQIMVVLQSSHIFNAMTASIRPAQYSTLDLVAKFLNQFTTMTIRVAAYTDDRGSPAVNRALTKEQAGSIVRYLWQAGVNTRLLTAAGMGGTHLVTEYTTMWDPGENYRVEITTEKLPIEGTLG